jgi:hypothetical protein
VQPHYAPRTAVSINPVQSWPPLPAQGKSWHPGTLRLLSKRHDDENGFLRFNGAVRRDPASDAWMKEHAGGLGAIAHQLFEVMRKCGDEVRELLHDGCPVACLGHVPFGYVNAFTSHVNVGFFHGAVPDPARLLQAPVSSCAM